MSRRARSRRSSGTRRTTTSASPPARTLTGPAPRSLYGPLVNVTYPLPGRYTVTLTVRDAAGNNGTQAQSVDLAPAPAGDHPPPVHPDPRREGPGPVHARADLRVRPCPPRGLVHGPEEEPAAGERRARVPPSGPGEGGAGPLPHEGDAAAVLLSRVGAGGGRRGPRAAA